MTSVKAYKCIGFRICTSFAVERPLRTVCPTRLAKLIYCNIVYTRIVNRLRIFEKKKLMYSKIVLNYIFSRLQKILKTNNALSGDINYTNVCTSLQNLKCVKSKHYVKSVRIRSVSGRHFLAFGLNTEVYSVNLRIQSEYGKMQTRKTPNTESYHAVKVTT